MAWWGWVLCIAGGIGGILLIIFAIRFILKFLSFIFLNFVASRIFSFAGNVASIVLAIIIVCSPGKPLLPLAIGATISTILSWMFFVAPIVFDTVDDFEFGELGDDFHFSQVLIYGGSLIGVGGVTTLLNMFAREDFPAIFFIIPIIICVIDVIFTLRAS